jgi:hypothetical protein
MRQEQMAVIIRETRIIGGKEVIIKVYKSKRFVTQREKEQAERLDQLIETKMRETVKEMEDRGLMKLKGRRGVIELWYNVGKHLHFVSDGTIVSDDDRDFIWQALYDHAGELHPGKSRIDRPESNYFRYCFLVSQFDWGFVKLSDWTSWVEFFDSKRIREDRRIIDWLMSRSKEKPSKSWVEFTKGSRQDWIRKLTKPIRHRFRNRATVELTKEELFSELDEIFSEIS